MLARSAEGLVNIACAEVDGVPVAVTLGRGVQVWDLYSGKRRNLTRTSASSVACTEVDGVPVAVVGGGVLRLWNLRNGEHRVLADNFSSTMVACANINGVPVAATTGADMRFGEVRLWDLHTDRMQYQMILPLAVRSLAFTHDNRIVVALDNELCLLNYRV